MVPTPDVNDHALVDEYATQLLHDEASLLKRIWDTPLASVAESLNVTDSDVVSAASLFIVTEPVGGVVSKIIVSK